MAFENTHIKIADRIYVDKINKHKFFRNEDFKQYFLFGSFSPDVPSYLPETDCISNFMHSGEKPDGLSVSTNELAFNILDECVSLKNEGCTEKALRNLMVTFGYLTHVATDVIFHPMVYSLSGYYPGASIEDHQKVRYEHWLIEGLVDRLCAKKFQELISEISEVNWSVSLIENIEIFAKHVGITTKLYRKAFENQLELFGSFGNDNKYEKYIKLAKSNKIPVCYLSSFSRHLDLMQGVFPEGTIKYMHPVTGNTRQTTVDRLVTQSIVLSTQLIDAAFEYYLQGNTSTKAKARRQRVIKPYNLNTGLIEYGKKDMLDQRKNNVSGLGNYGDRLPEEIQDMFLQ